MEKGCRNCLWLYSMVSHIPTAPCYECLDYNKWQTTKPTNADRIRSMTDEELADFLWSIGSNPVTGNYYLNGKLLFFCGNGNGWLDWLRQEARE